MTQSFTVLSTDVCILFSYFCYSLISVSKKRDIETMPTLSYSNNWQKFNKMNEKWSQVYQSMGTEYVTGQINSCILEFSFETVLPFDFCAISKIIICLIKRFPNDRKRYSSHLQVSILYQIAPVKVYLTVYGSLKNSYLKRVFVT